MVARHGGDRRLTFKCQERSDQRNPYDLGALPWVGSPIAPSRYWLVLLLVVRHGRLGAARCGTTAVVVAWSQPKCRRAAWSPARGGRLPHPVPQCYRTGRMAASGIGHSGRVMLCVYQ
jgi:hypothetical protein